MNFLCLVFAVIALTSSSPTSRPAAPKGFIIKLKSHAAPKQVASFVTKFNQAKGISIESQGSNQVKHVYQTFNGFSGSFSSDFLDAFKQEHSGDIEYIEPDGEKHIVNTQSNPPSWGLTRVGSRTLGANVYDYPSAAGAGVNVYIVDTGLQPNITDYQSRATMAKSFVTGEAAVDLNGHGSHVSGTIGGALYGVAKKVKLFGVKVLNGQGSGSDSDVVAGIDFVTSNAVAGKTVLNMSLGGSKSQAIDDAVDAAMKAGVVVIVAAGNDYGQDACEGSPSGSSGAFAVGSSNNSDNISDYSDLGPCVKLFAPGENIKSVWIGKTGKLTKTISGTSMASPHVAGVAALLLSQKSYSSVSDVHADLVSFATKDALTISTDDVNLLVYNKMSTD